MRDLKLYQALEIWFGGQQENQDAKYQEAEKYLRLRIRPAMEILLEEEDTERMQCLEEQGSGERNWMVLSIVPVRRKSFGL